MPTVKDVDEMKMFIKSLTTLSYETLEEFVQYISTRDIQNYLTPDIDVKAFIFPVIQTHLTNNNNIFHTQRFPSIAFYFYITLLFFSVNEALRRFFNRM